MEHQLTVPYTPEQNGVSERKNRTVVEMARCMLFQKNLPKTFWAEAVYTAVYLQNRLPTAALEGMTPIEAWTDVKPSAKHLKVFGSICYYHVPDVKRDKLGEKAEKGIFLGYSAKSKGYKICSLKNDKIVVSRDVKVDEDCHWDWEQRKVVKDSVSAFSEDTNVESFAESDDSEMQSSVEDCQSSDSDGDSPPLKTRPLKDIYQSCNMAIVEPLTYAEAMKNEEWRAAMKEEIEMIEKNETWELMCRPKGKKVIGVKWIYRIKLNANGSVNKYKARLVVKGYSQELGVDYVDTFAPVARLDTIRLLIALAAQHKWEILQLDVKSAFLNGYLNEEIFIEQPEGFSVSGEENKVYRLRKALYGLKQAPRAWYSRIDSYLLNQRFVRSDNDATLYVKHHGGKSVIVSLYVDDLLVTGSDKEAIHQFKEEMKSEFEMTDLGAMSFFLGMEIQQFSDGIFISQQKYAKEILKRFSMQDCKPTPTPLVLNERLSKFNSAEKSSATTYRSLVGSLLYLTATRPDLMFSASLLSRFMQSPSKTHFGAAKRVLRYLKGTVEQGIWYSSEANGGLKGFAELKGYADSDWAGSVDDMRSTSGYCFSFNSGVFSWNSKKQSVVAQSTAEAEYISAAAASNQAIWLRKLLTDLGESQLDPTVIYCDNKSAIAIAKNPVHHGKTKHIKVKYHSIREAERNGEICLLHCKSEDQIADIFTKALPKLKFDILKAKLGVSVQTSRRSVNI